MRLRAAVLVLTAVAGTLLIPSSSAQTFRIERKDHGVQLTDRYPKGDFQVQLRIKLDKPGSILDTVGIDAAPVGSWSLVAGADGKVSFSLWDGSAWSAVTCNEVVPWGQDTYVTVRRVEGSTTLYVQSSWSRKTLKTELSGRPVYVGDYSPDSHWGQGYDIHRAAIGQIEVIYIGAAKFYPGSFTDFAGRIRDERGLVSEAERQRLASALKSLKERKGYDVAVAFLPEGDTTAGHRRMDSIAHILQAEGKLPDTYAVLGYLGDSLRLYHRTSGFDKLTTWDDVKAVWDRQPKTGTRPQIMAMTLSEMAGVATGVRDTEVKTEPKNMVEGKGSVGAAGGVVTAGLVRVDIPAGALIKEDTLVVREGVPTLFGDPGVSIEFTQSAPVLLKPATITFPVPVGSVASQLVALRSLGKNAWVTLPLTVIGDKAVAKTNHFCDTVLINLGRTKAKFVGAVSGGVGGTIVLTALGLAPTTSGMSVLVAIPFLAVGWLAGGSAYDDAQRAGLHGPYPSPGFQMFWTPRLIDNGPYISFLIDKRNGNLIGPSIDSRDTGGKTFIGPATSAPRDSLTYTLGEREIVVPTNDVGELKVPLSVLGVAGELDVARRFYTDLGFTTPERTTVYVYERLGKSKDQAKETNSGEWDGKILQINSKSLNPLPPNTVDSRAASCHEYWHAVSTHNGFSEPWIGAEEAMAVAMESLVWATPLGVEGPLMDDFLGLHAWVTCTPVLRSGLYWTGPNEDSATRGYKQWAFVKYVYHKYGKEALRDLVTGKMATAKLDEALIGFGLAGLISNQVISDPTVFDHPVFLQSKTKTGFEKPSLIQDAKAGSVKFGWNDLPKSDRGSINAYVLSVPDRAAGVPASPILVRRRFQAPEFFAVPERLYGSKPSSAGLPQPALVDLKTDERIVTLPEAWDTGGRMAVMVLGLTSITPLAPPSGPVNPLLIYRLAPPTGVNVEHLPTIKDEDAKSRFTWTLPDVGAGIEPSEIAGAYRLYGRKKGQPGELIAEIVPRATRQNGRYAPPSTAIQVNADARTADVAIARTRVLGYEEFAMSTVDGFARVGGKPLESPIGWAGGSSLLAALEKCNGISFSAHLNFVSTTTYQLKDQPPRVETTTYPVDRAVNAPDVWGFSSVELKAGKLTIKNGHVEFKFAGPLKDPNAKSADSLLDSLNAFNPMWPFNAGSAIDGSVSVTLTADIAADGRLTNGSLVVEHALYGCSMRFGDFVSGVVKLGDKEITIGYMLAAQEATAKTSPQSGWMRWVYTNGSTEFQITKFLGARALNLTFYRK